MSGRWADDSCGGLKSSLRMWAGVVVPWFMARILLGAGMLANISYYHQTWLFEPLIFLLCWTTVTTMQRAITPSPAGCQAGRGSIINPCLRKIARSGRSHA